MDIVRDCVINTLINPHITTMRLRAHMAYGGEQRLGRAGLWCNKAGYTAAEVACGWAGAIFEVTRPCGQEQ